MADSSSIDPADSLLINGFLANRESFAQKMEEIYEKFGREYGEDEDGGKVIDFTDKEYKFNRKVHELFSEMEEKEVDAPSSESEEEPGGDSDSEGDGDEDDTQVFKVAEITTANFELVKRLNEKVIQVKRELNWTVVETHYQKMQREKKARSPSPHSSEDEEENISPVILSKRRASNYLSSILESDYLEESLVSDYMSDYERTPPAPKRTCHTASMLPSHIPHTHTPCHSPLLSLTSRGTGASSLHRHVPKDPLCLPIPSHSSLHL